VLSEQWTVADTNHFVSTRWRVAVALHRVVVAQHSAASVPLPVELPPLPNASFPLAASPHPPGTINIQFTSVTSSGEFVVHKAGSHPKVLPALVAPTCLKHHPITHDSPIQLHCAAQYAKHNYECL